MNWRTANNHRKKAALRSVTYIDMGWPFGIMVTMTVRQNPRRPWRKIVVGGKEYRVGPGITSRSLPA